MNSKLISVVERIKIQKCRDQSDLDEMVQENGWSKEKSEFAFNLRFGQRLAPSDVSESPGIYSQYLSHLEQKGFDNLTVSDIDRDVKDVYAYMLLRDPKTTESRTCDRNVGYGLVVGRVQSGKTANMIGLAIRAMDPTINKENTPIDTVIILSGLIDDLRNQTFKRLTNATLSGVKITPEGYDLTKNSPGQKEIITHLSNPAIGPKMVIVIKKNHTVLQKLSEIIESLDPKSLHKTRIMIIDDECDHASMDSANAESSLTPREKRNITATNETLRHLIKITSNAMPTTWYIGYTATPYSNLLMDPEPDLLHPTLGLTLFPRDFIVTLPKPRGHLDNEDYFLAANDNLREQTIPVINSDSERILVEDVLMLHLATWIVKQDLRKIQGHHSSLIHTDVSTSEHERIIKILKNELGELKEKSSVVVCREIQLVVEKYFLLGKNEKKELNGKLLQLQSPGDQVLPRIIGRITPVQLNRSKVEDLEESDFTIPQELFYKGRSKSLIVVGGTRLARGLTLEGLTISWFTRTSTAPKYDTLLQMARWCGYRPQYSDLVRIITDSESKTNFEKIARVELELRTKLEAFTTQTDPLKEIIWIRKYKGMDPTGRLPPNIQRRIEGGISSQYWSLTPPELNSLNQGIANEKSFENFIKLVNKYDANSELIMPPKGEKNFKIIYGVETENVELFLEGYLASYGEEYRSNETFAEVKNLLLQLKSKPFSAWNIAINTPSDRTRKQHNGYKMVDRFRVTSNELKMIHSGSEVFEIELKESELRQAPLLIVYLSTPNHTYQKERVYSTDVCLPVTLFGILTPGSQQKEPDSHVGRPVTKKD